MEFIFSVFGWICTIVVIGASAFILIHYERQWYDHIVYKIKMRKLKIRPYDESFVLELIDYCNKNKCEKYFQKAITESINLMFLCEVNKTLKEVENSVYMITSNKKG